MVALGAVIGFLGLGATLYFAVSVVAVGTVLVRNGRGGRRRSLGLARQTCGHALSANGDRPAAVMHRAARHDELDATDCVSDDYAIQDRTSIAIARLH